MTPGTWILASGSPRRRELLAALNPDFRVISPEVEEWLPEFADPAHQVEENACRKGQAVAESNPDSLVIAADTTVALGKRLFGKPQDASEAVSMLLALSGKQHQVLTGVALYWPGGSHFFHDSSAVTFLSIDEQKARDYMDRVHVFDKAGAYAIQEHGNWIIEGHEGSFENIMGLPVQRLRRELVQLGYGEILTPEK